jgi:hypothetical protein
MGSIKKPNRDAKVITGQDDEKAMQGFSTQLDKTAQGDAPKKPVLIRFDPRLLERVDTAAKRRGISRSAWIQFTVSRALDQGDG